MRSERAIREKEMVTKRRREKDSPSSNRLQSFPPDLLRFQESVQRIRNTYIYTCVDGVCTRFYSSNALLASWYARGPSSSQTTLRDEAALSRVYDNFLRVARRTAVESHETPLVSVSTRELFSRASKYLGGRTRTRFILFPLEIIILEIIGF